MGFLRQNKKKKIGFWAGDQNNFQFVESLIAELKQNYSVEKFEYFDDVNNLRSQLKKVDIAWFEWGNGPIVPASQMEHTGIPIINRIHRYEVYSESARHINWNSVSNTIFSSPSMKEKFKHKYPDQFKTAQPEWIPIGVDTKLFKFKEKEITKQLIYVGRIHPHKNPSMLLQIFAKLLQQDSAYQLTIIGGFSDELYEEYYYDQVKKLKLTNNIKMLGKMKQSTIVKHLQDADYFLITSIIEGLSQASLEAMACGVRPVIFNYYGSEKGYPNKYIYKTIDEAVEMIMNPVGTRQESRDIIEDKHVLSDQVVKIEKMINGLLG